MAPGPWHFVDSYRDRLASRYTGGGSANTFKTALFLSTSNLGVTSTTYAGLTNEHANANGYTTGGVSVSFSPSGTDPSVTMPFTANPTWAASGGNIVFRWAVVYEVGGNVVCFCWGDRTSTAVSDAVWGTPTGNNVTITSAGAGLPVLSAGQYFEVEDHSNTANNGLYVATGSPTASSLPATKLEYPPPVAAASEAVTVYRGADVTVTNGSGLIVDADGAPEPVFEIL